MRRAAGLLFVLIAGTVLTLLLGRTAEPGSAAAGVDGSREDPPVTPAAGVNSTVSDAAQRPDRVELPVTGDDTAQRRYRYRLIDARTSAPLAGVRLRAIKSGGSLATTDATGTAELVDCDVSDVVFAAPGYLLEFHGLGSDGLARLRERSPQHDYEIRLHRDDYSLPLRLQFVRSDGGVPAGVRLRLRCVEPALPEIDDLPALLLSQQQPSPIIEAWHRHTLAAMLWRLAAEPFYHFGATSSHVVFQVAAESEIRFVVGGEYALEAISAEGEVGDCRVRVTAGSPGPVRVKLGPGSVLTGQVVSAGTPIAGASVRTEPPALGAETVTADAAGRFRLAPLPSTPLGLVVEHRRFATRRVSAQPGSDNLSIELQPSQLRRFDGRVRLRGRGTAIAGARVSLRDNGRVDGEVTTTADGGFAVETAFENPELWVVADGFLDYVEVPDPGVTHVECELLPASIDARAAAGLSAAITGTVHGVDGKPRQGVTVRLVTEQPAPWGGSPGRRILRGGVLQPQPAAITGADGGFTLECTVAGVARIVLVDGGAAADDGQRIAVHLGSREHLLLKARQ